MADGHYGSRNHRRTPLCVETAGQRAKGRLPAPPHTLYDCLGERRSSNCNHRPKASQRKTRRAALAALQDDKRMRGGMIARSVDEWLLERRHHVLRWLEPGIDSSVPRPVG